MTSLDADFYRRLLETSPGGVALVDALHPDHPVIYVNPAFEVLTGYCAADLLGRNLRLLQGEDREQDGRHRLREAMRLGESCRVLLRNYRKDGTLFWNEMTILPLLDAGGRMTHFAGHHRDAGERLRIDPKLARDSLSGAHQPTGVAVRDDRLTGLYTLPYLQELLKRDWAIAQREHRSIAVFAIDIDALDLYNATFGRAVDDSTRGPLCVGLFAPIERCDRTHRRRQSDGDRAGADDGAGTEARPAHDRTGEGSAHSPPAVRGTALCQRQRRRVR